MHLLRPTACYHRTSYFSCSVLFSIFEGVPYLLCGLGDGHLVTYRLQDGLTDMRKLALGTKPITLKSFRFVHLCARSEAT